MIWKQGYLQHNMATCDIICGRWEPQAPKFVVTGQVLEDQLCLCRTIALFVLGLTAGKNGETGRTGLTASKASVIILCSVYEHLSAKTCYSIMKIHTSHHTESCKYKVWPPGQPVAGAPPPSCGNWLGQLWLWVLLKRVQRWLVQLWCNDWYKNWNNNGASFSSYNGTCLRNVHIYVRRSNYSDCYHNQPSLGHTADNSNS